ncbi:Cruciform DNA binding protein [Diaporthe australafricana]|uniref:Cruciform DNA binding protein n=1 Tax=Diaporthe australafricana TaxID=127596 RepID=A0ABR3WMK6_9PEZI
MSLSGEEARKTEALPGAFPSEEAIAQSQLNSTDSTIPATTGRSTSEYPGRDLTSRQNIAHTGAAGQAKASPADADPDHLLRRAGAEGVPAAAPGAATTSGLGSQQNSDSVLGNAAGASAGRAAAPQPGGLASAANPLSGPAVAADDDLGPENAPNITEDLKNLGSGAATAATVVGLAARDAAVAVKDAAAPVVSAASEQAMQAAGYAAENAGPAASAASEQAGNAAGYARENVVPAANAASQTAGNAAGYTKDAAISAASTVQANAPTALGGGGPTNTVSARDIVPEVPGQVKSSIAEAGEAPEAAASRRAVHDKGAVESELLGYAAEVDADEAAARRAQQQQQQQPPPARTTLPPTGLPSGLDSGPQTPSTGTAVVLGTDTERAFPLGSHPTRGGAGASTTTTTGPSVTSGLQTSDAPLASSGTGRGVSASDAGLMSHAEDRGAGAASTGDRKPAERHMPPPVEDKVPKRAGEEVAVGNGPGVYKTLSSGTPSGVGQ